MKSQNQECPNEMAMALVALEIVGEEGGAV